MDTPVHAVFTVIDWVVVVGYLLLTTLFGHFLRGEQGTIRDFFLGGRTLPWQAVTGSMIATEISALTFIGVPGTVFAVNGDFTYLQWALGSVMARFAVGYFLVPLYYEKEIYSPYDFMGNRLGLTVKKVVTLLFSVGAILGQSVRVLVTALILKVVTGLPIDVCIVIIGVFAVAWTLMGGMRTVIWTDVIQFFLFLGGGLLALGWILSNVAGGWNTVAETNRHAEVISFTWDGGPRKETIYQVATEEGERAMVAVVRDPQTGIPVVTGTVIRGETPFVEIQGERVGATIEQRNKLKLMEYRMVDPETKDFLIFTIWIALFAMPFQNFAAFGTDQLMAQRMFCCRSAADARKSMVWSSVSQVITVIMLMVSAGLYTWYQQRALTPSEFALFSADTNNVFPVWITSVLPTGLSGLLIAGAFAAAISSLDSILAALSQTTLSIFYGRERFENEQGSKGMVWRSRLTVLIWGVILSLFAILLNVLYQMGDRNLIGFAFRMVSYTYGPMLGILFLAILPVRHSTAGIILGAALSIGLTAMVLPDVSNLLKVFGVEGARPLNTFPFPWFFPINAGITFFCGWLLGRWKPDAEEQAAG